VGIVVVVSGVLLPYVYLLHCVGIAFLFLFIYLLIYFTLDAGLLATGQYSEGPATGHLDTGFSWFSCAQKQMLRWFPKFQVATTCFSCSPPDLNLVVTNLIFCIHVKKPLPTGNNPIAVNKYYYFKLIPFSGGFRRSLRVRECVYMVYECECERECWSGCLPETALFM